MAAAACPTFAQCCAVCKADTDCGAFVWGPMHAGACTMYRPAAVHLQPYDTCAAIPLAYCHLLTHRAAVLAGREAGPNNPNTCFTIGATNETRKATGRSFGCLRGH